jgi:hypothetical protein
MADKAAREAIEECRDRLNAYAGTRVSKTDVAEWLDKIIAAMDAPSLEYGVDFGAWGT